MPRVPHTKDGIPAPLPMHRIVRTWWPLALSWLLMAVESPAVSAIVARLAEPQINLAAFGGLVWPLALIIESPILMLLSASTALSKDWDLYLRLRRFTMRAGAVLTALHVLIIFTPPYYTVAVKLIGAPAEIVEPARLGLMVMIPSRLHRILHTAGNDLIAELAGGADRQRGPQPYAWHAGVIGCVAGGLRLHLPATKPGLRLQ
jgi:hypothetical protein